MASRRELPPDVAAALDRVPEAGSRFAALPPDRQAAWIDWIDRARGRRARAGRIDEMVRRLLPSAAVAEEEVAEPVGPPPERYWWLWLLLLLLLVVGGLLAWYFLSRGNDKAVVPNVIGLREQQAEIRIHDRGLEALPRSAQSNRPPGVVFAEKPGAGTQLGKGQTVTIFVSSGRLAVPDVTGLTAGRRPAEVAGARLQGRGQTSGLHQAEGHRPRPGSGRGSDRPPWHDGDAERVEWRQARRRSSSRRSDAGRCRAGVDGARSEARAAERPVRPACRDRRRPEASCGEGGRQGRRCDGERLDRDRPAHDDRNDDDDDDHHDDDHHHDNDRGHDDHCRTRSRAACRRARPDARASAPQRARPAPDRRLRALEPAGEQGRLAIAEVRHHAAARRARAGQRLDRAEPPAEHGRAERRRPRSGNGRPDPARRRLQGRGAEPPDRRPVQGRPRGRAAAARDLEHPSGLAGHDLHRPLLG